MAGPPSLILLFCFVLKTDAIGKVTTFVNPLCPAYICNSTKVNMLYARQEDVNSSIHYLIASGKLVGSLSFHILHSSDPNDRVLIDWERFLSASLQNKSLSIKNVKGSNKIISQSAVVVSQLINLNWENEPKSYEAAKKRFWNTSDFVWSRIEEVNRLKFNFSAGFGNGSIIVTVEFSETVRMADTLPRLHFSGKNFHMTTELDDLPKHFKKSRFGWNLFAINYVPTEVAADMPLFLHKFIDDEYTPGVFQFSIWQFRAIFPKVYLQWKNIAYLTRGNSATENAIVFNYNRLVDVDDFSLLQTLSYALLGDDITNHKLVATQSVIIVFGNTNKDLYGKYTKWTTSFGVGIYLSDRISFWAVIFAVAIVTLPIIMLSVSGLVYVFRRNRNVGFAELE